VVLKLEPTGVPPHLADLGYDGLTWEQPWNLVRGQITSLERMPSVELSPGGPPVEIPPGPTIALDGVTVTDPLTGRDMGWEEFLGRRLFNDGLLVVHRGRLVHESYRDGVRADDRHIMHSCSKTLTTMMIGWAVEEGRLATTAPMQELMTDLAALPAWDGVTLQHVLDMAAGLDTEEHYENADSMYWRYADAVGYFTVPAERQIGALEFVRRELVRRREEPGTLFNYASYLTNLLPMVLEREYGVPAVELYETYLYAHVGAERPALVNVDAFGAPITEGQVNLTLRDFARWAYPMVNGGKGFGGEQVVPSSWVDETYRHDAGRAAAFAASESAQAHPGGEYHNQTWVLEPGDVVAMLGIHGQFAYLDRRRDLMIVGASSFPDQANALLTSTMQQVWERITDITSGQP
jgi:CubicO group peptidase (beta-lactamase class C family)